MIASSKELIALFCQMVKGQQVELRFKIKRANSFFLRRKGVKRVAMQRANRWQRWQLKRCLPGVMQKMLTQGILIKAKTLID